MLIIVGNQAKLNSFFQSKMWKMPFTTIKMHSNPFDFKNTRIQ